MHRIFLPAVVLCLTVSGAAQAQSRPPKAVWDAVATHLDNEVNMASIEADLPERAPVSQTTPTPRMFSRFDVNGDGIADWRVNYGKAPNPSFFCGTGGCRQEIWVSEPGDSYRRVMSIGVRDLKLTRRAGVTRLDLDFHGSACGGYGAQACPRAYEWRADGGEFVAIAPPGRTWLYGGPNLLEPMKLENAAPPGVLAGVERMQMECQVNQGYFNPEWGVNRIPDIDGDGRRDWVIGSGFAACEYAMEDAANTSPPLPLKVYVTAGSAADAVLAWEGVSMHYGVDAGAAPATFYVIATEGADCEHEKPCGRRLRWDAAAGKLVEAP